MGMTNEEYAKFREEEWERLEAAYDFHSVEGIRSIPVPCKEVNGDSPTGRVEYYLHGLRWRWHIDNGNIDLAIECVKKAHELMFISDMIWKYDAFISGVSWLHQIGRHDEAREMEQQIDAHFDRVGHYSKLKIWNFRSIKSYLSWRKTIAETEKERLRLRKLRHEFWWMQEHAGTLCPKSISSYSRMKNQKTPKYIQLCQFAAEQGCKLFDESY